MAEALPAVTLPSFLKAGRSLARTSGGLRRGPSSVSKTMSPFLFLMTTGTISVLERAGLDGSLGLGLALESKVVQIFTAQVPLVGHVLGGDAHVGSR